MKRFFGGILMALGILVAGLSGLCTLIFVGLSLFATGSGSGVVQGVLGSLLSGALPILIGVGLILAGRALLKKP